MGKNTKTAEKKINKYQELVDRIITIMETNMIVPWSAGFLGDNKSLLNMVVNHSSRRPYNGGNSFILQLFGNSSSGEYITLKNAKKMYGKKEDGSDVYPKKGTHACYVVYPMIYNETQNRFWQKNDDPNKNKRVFKGKLADFYNRCK